MTHDEEGVREDAPLGANLDAPTESPNAPVDGSAATVEGIRQIWLRDYSPGWFGAVMGTGAVAVAASINPGHVISWAPAARTFGQVMAVITAVLAVVLIIPYLARFVRYGRAALTDLLDPLRGAQFATLPAGILVLALTASAIGPTWWSTGTVRDLVAGLDWLGIPLAFAMSIMFSYLLFVRAQMDPGAITGRWYIPPVAAIVVPLVLIPLMPGDSPTVYRTLVLTSYGFWGMGFVLYLHITTTLHHRLVGRGMPAPYLSPMWAIGLGPVAIGAVSLVKLAAATTAVFGSVAHAVSVLSLLAATALWGFGVWWLVAALTVLVVHYLRHGIPYEVGWWGFLFPLGAYTILTIVLARAWHLAWLEWTGAALFVLLGLLWIFVFGATIRAVFSGKAFRRAGTSPMEAAVIASSPDP
jgi:C4-dicarboxylate transporter/malic acid transport protein